MRTKLRQKPALVLLNGKRVHPLVFVRHNCNLKQVAKALGHSNHTTFSIYSGKAAKSKVLPVPAEWCLPLSALSGLRPAEFRPDLYKPEWTVVDTANKPL